MLRARQARRRGAASGGARRTVVDFVVPPVRLVIEVDGSVPPRPPRRGRSARPRAPAARLPRAPALFLPQLAGAPRTPSSIAKRVASRSCAPAVFPKLGLCPSGEDGSLRAWCVVAERHERLVVPRPGAVVGLRSTGARSAPRRAVTGSRVPITMALAREEALRAARHRSCALGREARPPRRASLPAPTRRRCAASVFPKLGLRPSGEDGLRRERARAPGWRSPPDFATSPPAGERILRGFAALPRGTGLAHARMAWAIPHTRLHRPSDRVPAIDRRAPCSTRRWRSTGRRSWRGPKSTAACRASPRRLMIKHISLRADGACDLREKCRQQNG